MTSLRLAALAVLIAAAIAGCITYFATPGSPQRTEADQRMPPAEPSATGRPASGATTNIRRPSTEDNITAYQRAAEAILKGSQNAKASADVPLVTGRIPLPKRRPILRP
jgi:hypothetical protein